MENSLFCLSAKKTVASSFCHEKIFLWLIGWTLLATGCRPDPSLNDVPKINHGLSAGSRASFLDLYRPPTKDFPNDKSERIDTPDFFRWRVSRAWSMSDIAREIDSLGRVLRERYFSYGYNGEVKKIPSWWFADYRKLHNGGTLLPLPLTTDHQLHEMSVDEMRTLQKFYFADRRHLDHLRNRMRHLNDGQFAPLVDLKMTSFKARKAGDIKSIGIEKYRPFLLLSWIRASVLNVLRGVYQRLPKDSDFIDVDQEVLGEKTRQRLLCCDAFFFVRDIITRGFQRILGDLVSENAGKVLYPAQSGQVVSVDRIVELLHARVDGLMGDSFEGLSPYVAALMDIIDEVALSWRSVFSEVDRMAQYSLMPHYGDVEPALVTGREEWVWTWPRTLVQWCNQVRLR